jgi:hypothetical protein
MIFSVYGARASTPMASGCWLSKNRCHSARPHTSESALLWRRRASRRRRPNGVSIPSRESALLWHMAQQSYERSRMGFTPFQGICPSVAASVDDAQHDETRFNPFQGICPSVANQKAMTVPATAEVSIPSRESALLWLPNDPSAARRADRFNPFQGICPSVAGKSPDWALPRERVSIPSRESALLWPKTPAALGSVEYGFNPFQGICPSVANAFANTSYPGEWFQSLPGNLPFCGRLPLQRCIFMRIARIARASPPKASKRHRRFGGMSVS